MTTRVLAGLAAIFVLAACDAGGPLGSEASPSRVPSASVAVSPAPSSTVVSSKCVQPDDPASHVYHPDRLDVLEPCITASGAIAFERREPDGDYHIGLKLDPQFAGLVNACNATCLNGAEHGDLVLEPICELPVTQADAVAACTGYHNPLIVPPIGSHVIVTGPHVLDLDHGWLEIHPVASLVVM
jgi:hypothetical protein